MLVVQDVVQVPVVRSARRAQPDRVRSVAQSNARCAARDPVRRVVQTAASSSRVVLSCR